MRWPCSNGGPEKEKWADLGISYKRLVNIRPPEFYIFLNSERGKASYDNLGGSYCVGIQRRTGFFKYRKEEVKFFDTKEEAEAFITKELSSERKSSRTKNLLRNILEFLDWAGARGRSAYDSSDMHMTVTNTSLLESFLYTVPLAVLSGGNPYSFLIIPATVGTRNLHARYEFEKTKKAGK